jgi:hypothetical protein
LWEHTRYLPRRMTPLMPSDVLVLIAIFVSLVFFDLAALRWGVDSRRGLDPRLPFRREL